MGKAARLYSIVSFVLLVMRFILCLGLFYY